MKKHFNLSYYKELLKSEENGEILFLDFELVSYKASIMEQIYYNRKKDYFLLIKEYLNQSISPSRFRFKFLQMKKEDSKKSAIILEDFQKLEVFTLAKDREKFSNLIFKISTLCFEYNKL